MDDSGKISLPSLTVRKKDKPAEKDADRFVAPVYCVSVVKVHCNQPEILQQSEAVQIPCSSGNCDRFGLIYLDCFFRWE